MMFLKQAIIIFSKGAGTGGAGGARAPPALWPGRARGTLKKVKIKEKRCPYAKTSALLASCAPPALKSFRRPCEGLCEKTSFNHTSLKHVTLQGVGLL